MKTFRLFSSVLPVAVSCGSLFLLTQNASAVLIPTTSGPNFGIDDYNTSTLNPSPVIQVSTLAGAQCPWINSGLNGFISSHPGWSYSWASQADMAKVEQGISILDYYAWTVTEPPVTDARGTNWTIADPPLLPTNTNDVGGATFNLKYTPVAGAHVFTDLHWIQGLSAYYDNYGYYASSNFQVRLDNPFASNNTPFYDTGGAAGKLSGGGGWFLDTPFKIESEPLETNPVADVQFQVVLADFNAATTNITLYGGEWWGYKYTASDTLVPEPWGLLPMAACGLAFLLMRRERRRSKIKPAV